MLRFACLSLLLAGCKDKPAPNALTDPCAKVRQHSGREELVCTVDLIDEPLAALLSKRPDRDEVQLLFTTTDPFKLASAARVAWVRSVLIYPEQGSASADLRQLHSLRGLRSLNVRSALVREVEDAWAFPELTTLYAVESGTVELTGAPRTLRDLSVGPVIDDLRPLAALTSLEQLELPGKHHQLAGLSSLVRLESLSIVVSEKAELTPFSQLTALRELSIRGASLPALAAATEKLPHLTRLFLDGDDQAVDTKALGRLRQLQLLDFGSLPVTDLAPLQALPALKELSLWNAKVKDLEVLLAFPALGRVMLPKDTPDAVRTELRRQRPTWFLSFSGTSAAARGSTGRR
ncbi:MAG: hypothetical protein Q8N23_10785 [Archangium sp.]|nr:hypothetical protein [Archangium sp.]MDP3572050.1 hypothetical protein [Archangium sp.]